MVRSSNVKKANKATSSQLLACVSLDADFPYKIKISRASELDDNERHDVWSVLETNMRDLCIHSSLGWDVTEKRKELFHPNSRFLRVFDDNDLVAFSMFRFELEESMEVLYCYELQVCGVARRGGIGTTMMKQLSRIGSSYRMEKVMLTVLKDNNAALEFYKRIGLGVDETSPSMSEEEVDYEIMSRSLCTDVC